jgi:2-polyprenyl-6-methoxyphenol hydroxylase-like FAD-dependent oxidoreductase
VENLLTASRRALRVVVVGAGIGGLAVAAALRRVGAQVEVYERARAVARVGAGLQLAPNATSALRGIGLLSQVCAIASRPESWCSFSGANGELTMQLPLGDELEAKFGSPYLHVHRSDLQAVLLKAAGDIHLGRRAVGVEQDGEAATVRFADGESVAADLVIGADGVHSAIREMLFGAMPACFSGLVAYRGIVPADQVVHDVPLITAKWWGTDRHLVHYWVSGGRELNFVAPVPEEAWTEESWSAEGQVADLLDALSGFAEPVRQVAGAAATLMRSALYDRDPLPSWGDGRVTLLGDACHPMLPFMAQGAAMAIEDAVVLARCLDGVTTDGVADAVVRYAATRAGRTSAVQGGSRANDFLRGTSAGLSSEEVYGYDAWQVSLTA